MIFIKAFIFASIANISIANAKYLLFDVHNLLTLSTHEKSS